MFALSVTVTPWSGAISEAKTDQTRLKTKVDTVPVNIECISDCISRSKIAKSAVSDFESAAFANRSSAFRDGILVESAFKIG